MDNSILTACRCGVLAPQCDIDDLTNAAFIECLGCGRTAGALDRQEAVRMWNAASAPAASDDEFLRALIEATWVEALGEPHLPSERARARLIDMAHAAVGKKQVGSFW